MNDITNSSSTVAPPSSTPSAPDSSPPSGPEAQTPPETLAHMARGEDVSEYAEQRKEDAGEINRDATPSERAFNRHQRARAKIERLRAENAALKEHRAGPRSADGEPEDVRKMLHPEEDAAAQDHPAQDAEIAEQSTNGEQQEQQEPPETHEQIVERLAQEVAQDREREHHAGSFKARKEIFELMFPDNQAVLAQAPQVPVPYHVEHAILAARHGPFLQRLLAMPENAGDFFDLLQARPEHAVRAIAQLDAQIEAGAQQRIAQARQRQQPQYPQHRNVARTAAKPPIKPLRGSGGPTPSLAGLANSDRIDAYAAQRMRQMNAKNR